MARIRRSSSVFAHLACIVAVVSSAAVSRAAVVHHTFNVGNMSISQLCLPAMTITAVNGRLPGPTIHAREGDTVVVRLVNNSPYNMTIHWHGIFQRGSQWADGPAMVTQCPVVPGGEYTYRFNVTGQEGTLWWHAHNSILRATVYGALVIKPRRGGRRASSFPKPDGGEMVVVLGEWWNANVYELHKTAFLNGDTVPAADAYTINGRPGNLYNCSGGGKKTATTHVFKVRPGRTYLVRIINAALNMPVFFKVAAHRFTIVAADACYTTPYKTDVVVVFPGQTVDALMHADAKTTGRRRYYMAASPYDSALMQGPPFSQTVATAVVEYYVNDSSTAKNKPPVLPPLPEFNDTATAHRFLSNLTALVRHGRPSAVPLKVHTRMFVTVGLGEADCTPEQTNCTNPPPRFSSSMNNASFVLPKGTTTMLDAHYSNNITGVYTRDFPDTPPLVFDYTADESDTAALRFTTKSTKVRTLRYNETVEMVLQNTRFIAKEAHPMHLHGYNFFVLAQGFGNYDPKVATPRFNLVNPQERNTVAVPTGGWAVIRFVADNPGMWYMHCHFDTHLDLGLGMVFEVLNGPTPATSLPPPPKDLPKC